MIKTAKTYQTYRSLTAIKCSVYVLWVGKPKGLCQCHSAAFSVRVIQYFRFAVFSKKSIVSLMFLVYCCLEGKIVILIESINELRKQIKISYIYYYYYLAKKDIIQNPNSINHICTELLYRNVCESEWYCKPKVIFTVIFV